MTDGTKSGQKKTLKPRVLLIGLIAAVVLVITGVVAVLALQGGLYPAEGTAEAQLREQLMDSASREITVTGTLYLHGPAQVVGEKTILGDGKLKAVSSWKDTEGSYVLVLEDGASLTLSGSTTVDGNKRSGGVYVPADAELLVQEEATVKRASCDHSNVLAEGIVTLLGGTLSDAQGHNLYVAGTALLDGGTVSGSGKEYAGIYVAGTLEQAGGIVSDAYDNVYIAENGSFTWSGGDNNDSDNDGILVSAGGKLRSTSLAAIMNDAGRQGVHVYGEAVLDDIFLNASRVNQILVEEEGVLTLNNGAIDGSRGNGITNRGTMTMAGGEITNSAQCGIVCSGELTVTGGRVYASADQGLLLRNGSKASISGNGFSATGNSMGVLVEENAYAEVFDCNINSNDLYNFGCYGELYIHDLTTGGSGSNCINTHYSGHVIAENMTISGTAANNGIYNCNGSVVELTNVVIDSTKSNGIRNLDATLIAKDLTISNAGGHGISMSDYDFQGAGNVQLENVTMEGNKKANISLETDCTGTMQITNATLGKAGSNNISAKGGHLILTDVDVLGNVEKDASNHGIMLDEGCKITATNLLIQDVLKSGMRIRGGDFTGTNVTIKNTPVSGISSVTGPTNKRNGNINISGLTVTGAKENTIHSDCDGVIVITGGTLGATWSNNVRINKGSVTLNNVKVLGNTTNAKSKSEHAVFISHGALNMKDVTVKNAKAAGLRFGGGTVKAENVTIENSGSSGIFATSVAGEPAGVLTAKNLVITGSGDTNITNAGQTSLTVIGGRMDPAHSNNVRINEGFVSLENVEVLGQAEKNMDGTQHGLFITHGQLEIKNVTVKNTEGAGLRVGGGTVTGEKLTVENSGGSGIYNTSVEGQEGAKVTLTDVTVSGSADTNISNLGDVTMSVTNGVLDPVKTNNVRINNGDVTLNNVQVLGQIEGSKSSEHGIFIDGGKLTFRDVAVSDTSGSGIRHKGGYVIGTGLSLTDCGVYGISSSNGIVEGSMDVTDLQITGSASSNIHTDSQLPICVTNATLGVTSTNNVRVVGGVVTLNKVTILGTEGNGNHGIFNGNGTVIAKDLNIDSTCDALRLDGGIMTVENGKLTNSRRHGVNISKGQLTLTGITIDTTKEHGIFSYGAEGSVKAVNVQIHKAGKNGIGLENGTVEVDTVTVNTPGEYGVKIIGGQLTGKALTLEGISKAGIQAEKDGVIALEGLAINMNGTASADNNVMLESGFEGTVILTGVESGKTTYGNMVVKGGTLKLASSTVYGTVGAHHGIHVTGGTVEISEATIKEARDLLRIEGGTTTVSNTQLQDAKRHGVCMNGGKLIMTDSDIIGSTKDGINTWDAADIALTDCDITGSKDFGVRMGAGSLKLSGGYIYNNKNLDVHNAGTLTLNGVTVGYDAQGKAYGGQVRSTNAVLVTGSSVSAIHSQSGKEMAIQISQLSGNTVATFDSNQLAARLQSHFKAYSGQSEQLTLVKDRSLCLSSAVAMVGGTQYETLEAAIAAAQTGSDHTVVLVRDVTVTDTITITGSVILTDDGNVRTISRGGTGVMFQVNGSLTFRSTGLADVDSDGKATGNASKLIIDGKKLATKSSCVTAGSNAKINIEQGVKFMNFCDGKTAANGAVILLEGGKNAVLTVNGGVFSGNKTTGCGGVIAVYKNNTMNVSNAVFDDNAATGNCAGAIYMNNTGTHTVSNCVFTNHEGAWGGTVHADKNVNVTITGCTFKDNHATTRGAAIHATGAGSNVTVNSCRFESNRADKQGGAIHAHSGSAITITDRAFTGNSAPTGNAINIHNSATVTVDGKKVTGAVDNDQ